MRVAIVLSCLLLFACAGTPPRDDRPLYERLGGAPAIDAFVDRVIARSLADPKVAPDFVDTDLPYFRARLVEFVCSVTGGGCEYTGLPMDEAHSGLAITDAEFDHFAALLRASLVDVGAKEREIGEVIGAIEAMRPEIVGQ